MAMGCGIEHIGAIGYAEHLSLSDGSITPIGINCRVCPRSNCDQRAHHAAVVSEPVDEKRRGATRYAT